MHRFGASAFDGAIMADWLAWVVIVAPFLALLGMILSDARGRDAKIGLRGPQESLAVAIREWFKALSFLVGIAAAIFAYRQFEIARERSITDRRPWVGVVEIDQKQQAWLMANDGGMSFKLSLTLKNFGATPALNVTVRATGYLEHTDLSEAEKTHLEAEAVKTACKLADSSLFNSSSVLFPAQTDRSETYYGDLFDREAINKHVALATPEDPDALGLKVVVCVAYKSTLEAERHHSSQSLFVSTGYMPSQQGSHFVEISILPEPSYAGVAD